MFVSQATRRASPARLVAASSVADNADDAGSAWPCQMLMMLPAVPAEHAVQPSEHDCKAICQFVSQGPLHEGAQNGSGQSSDDDPERQAVLGVQCSRPAGAFTRG